MTCYGQTEARHARLNTLFPNSFRPYTKTSAIYIRCIRVPARLELGDQAINANIPSSTFRCRIDRSLRMVPIVNHCVRQARAERGLHRYYIYRQSLTFPPVRFSNNIKYKREQSGMRINMQPPASSQACLLWVRDNHISMPSGQSRIMRRLLILTRHVRGPRIVGH